MIKIKNLNQLQGYRTCVSSPKIAVRNTTDVGYLDYENKSGILTKVLRKEGIQGLDRFSDLSSYYTIVDNPYYQVEREKPVVCEICKEAFTTNRNGSLTRHLRDIHNMTPEVYMGKFPETSEFFPLIYKALTRKKVLEKDGGSIECPLCGERMKKITRTHIEFKHGMTVEEFKLQTGLQNLSSRSTRDLLGEEYRNRIRKVGKRLGGGKESKIEKLVREKLGGEKCLVEGREFDIRLGNTLIEVDGTFWHPSSLRELALSQMHNIINDLEKRDKALEAGFSIVKIYEDKIDKDNISLDQIIKDQYYPDYTIKYDMPIVTKEYLEGYKILKGKQKLQMYSGLFLKFLRTFQKDFPIVETTETLEKLRSVFTKEKIKKLQVEDGYRVTFNSSGTSFLKSRFRSYWESSNRGRMSPVEAWMDDKVLQSIINYRIGLNNTGEVFDFSLKNLVYGMSVSKFTVSFFRPELAASIYERYLGNKEAPVVFDPCMGFGGRLLGFKLLYPKGKYIGVEPNKKTFRELEKLVEECKFSCVELHNCTIEEFSEKVEYDFAFTSIPYYDLEDYKNGISYVSFEDWQEKFLGKLRTYPNIYLNIGRELYNKIKGEVEVQEWIHSNSSPFQKERTNREPVVQFKLKV